MHTCIYIYKAGKQYSPLELGCPTAADVAVWPSRPVAWTWGVTLPPKMCVNCHKKKQVWDMWSWKFFSTQRSLGRNPWMRMNCLSTTDTHTTTCYYSSQNQSNTVWLLLVYEVTWSSSHANECKSLQYCTLLLNLDQPCWLACGTEVWFQWWETITEQKLLWNISQ